MGFLSRLFKRPLTKDAFAQLVIKRLRESGESASIEYDAEQFQLTQPPETMFFLGNFFQAYQRADATEREDIIRSFLTTWLTSGLKPPDDFNDAKADLMPALRSRAHLEIDLHRVAPDGRSDVTIPHHVVAEHLIATLVYDLPVSMMSVNDEQLDKWGITYYEAMEIAKQNLHETTTHHAKMGSVYLSAIGDSYDATRLLLTDLIRSMEVKGDTIAMVPNRERLYVCGSEDQEGLQFMLKMATEDLQHERFITGMAFRLVDDDWETWMPAAEHPLYAAFNDLRTKSLGQTYAEQKDLLEKRYRSAGTDIYVASYSAMQNRNTGRVQSFCTWSEGVDTLLPETDLVMLGRPNAPKEQSIAAFGDWATVRRVAGDLMERQDTYPVRWRVREFPSAEMLAAIGIVEF